MSDVTTQQPGPVDTSNLFAGTGASGIVPMGAGEQALTDLFAGNPDPAAAAAATTQATSSYSLRPYTGGSAAPLGSATNAIIGWAQQALGTPYVWGGNTPGRGLDCSGLVQGAYRAAGISLPRTADEQARMTQPISLAQAQPGDLVYWDTDGQPGIDHIAIYAGNGQVLAASGSNRRVVLQPLWGHYQIGRVITPGQATAPASAPSAPSAPAVPAAQTKRSWWRF